MLLRKNKKIVVNKFNKGEINKIQTICPHIFDTALEVTDKEFGVFEIIKKNFDYCKMHQDAHQAELFLLSMISAKSKKMFAITDVGLALTSPYALEKLGLALRTDKAEIMTEGTVRNFINKVKVYEDEEKTKADKKKSGHLWIDYCNRVCKDMLEKTENTNVHILDCVKIPVTFKNKNYELSTVITYEKEKMRGYKLGVLRRVTETGGMLEYIIDGTISDNDLKLVKEEIIQTEIIKENEYLIMDRGFADISFISELVKKGIKIIIPAKKNMNIYQIAKEEAIKQNIWKEHPNSKRKGQEIALVTDLEGEWILEKDKNKKPGKEKNKEVNFNACVIRIEKTINKNIVDELAEDENEEDEKYIYIVILSTDTEITESKIVRIYEQRTEIEEDFRQVKTQWDLATFTSTKYNFIMCHIVMLLLGYNIFSMFKSTELGAKYRNKDMSSIMKSLSFMKFHPSEIHYFVATNTNFCILETKEIFMLFGKCGDVIQGKLLEYL
jgi:hypothetical protein